MLAACHRTRQDERTTSADCMTTVTGADPITIDEHEHEHDLEARARDGRKVIVARHRAENGLLRLGPRSRKPSTTSRGRMVGGQRFIHDLSLQHLPVRFGAKHHVIEHDAWLVGGKGRQ